MNTKANTLRYLHNQLTQARILPMMVITWEEWQNNRQQVLTHALARFLVAQTTNTFVVRSSCLREDSSKASLAGHFLSLLNVSGSAEEVETAINRVFDSYGYPCDKDQVLIQPQLINVKISGVIFNYDPNTGAPYYIINYDNSSQRTDSVTSGDNTRTNTRIIAHRDDSTTGWQARLIDTVKEVQVLTRMEALDIEFAFDDAMNLILLQSRPLCLNHHLTQKARAKYDLELNCIYKKVNRLAQPHPYLLGKKTLFGVMPDWNPAEIIGTRPKPLAASLYKELVTDRVWAQQRYNYGYRDVRDFPLVITLGGIPYIDVRASFNSFIPAQLNDTLAAKLTNFYLDKLERNTHLHDKIEFEIAHTCYSFDLDERLAELRDANFSKSQINAIKTALREQTQQIIQPDSPIFQQDKQRVTQLAQRQQQVSNSSLNQVESIYWTIQDCKAYGTLPFAGLARCGFIAMQMLNSLVSIGLLSQSQKEMFLNSVCTVSSKMVEDFHRLEKTEFLSVYGHLRPGTYDITSLRYDESPDSYFKWQHKAGFKHKPVEFYLPEQQQAQVDELLHSHKIPLRWNELFQFIREAIEQREMAKFLFTKSLSDCLKTITELGARFGYTREQLSYTTIGDFINLYSTSASAKSTLKNGIRFGKKAYGYASTIQLPPLICRQEQVLSFELPNDHPNFITHNQTTANTEHLKPNQQTSLRKKIVFIDSADPGYDWIFSQGIAGLITKYGGCNSHMAIRAAELNLPAVIGAGEKLFSQWKTYRKLQLDCANKTVLRLQ